MFCDICVVLLVVAFQFVVWCACCLSPKLFKSTRLSASEGNDGEIKASYTRLRTLRNGHAVLEYFTLPHECTSCRKSNIRNNSDIKCHFPGDAFLGIWPELLTALCGLLQRMHIIRGTVCSSSQGSKGTVCTIMDLVCA